MSERGQPSMVVQWSPLLIIGPPESNREVIFVEDLSSYKVQMLKVSGYPGY